MGGAASAFSAWLWTEVGWEVGEQEGETRVEMGWRKGVVGVDVVGQGQDAVLLVHVESGQTDTQQTLFISLTFTFTPAALHKPSHQN